MPEIEVTEEQKQAMWDELAAQPRGDNAPAAPSPAEPAPAATATDTPADGQQAAGEAPVEPQAPVDPIAALRAEFDAAKSLMERRVRSAEGRASKAAEAAAALEARLAAAQAAAPAQPSADQVRAAAGDSGKWGELKRDYPEWADAIEERFGTQNGKGDQEAIRALEKRAADERAAAVREREELSKDLVESVHPGWVDTIRSPEFDTWIEEQPARVAKLADSAKPSDAIKLLNLFKFGAESAPAASNHPPASRSAAEIAAERQQRLESSVTAPRSNGSRSPSKSINDMTPAEYWDYLAAKNRREQGAT